MVHPVSSASRRFAWRLVGSLVAILMGLGLCPHAEGRASITGEAPRPCLHASDICKLAKLFGSAKKPDDSYPAVIKLALENSELDGKNVAAFEENRFFVYAAGSNSGSGGSFQDGHVPSRVPRWARRFIILKPSIFVVDDEVVIPDSAVPIQCRLYSTKKPGGTGRTAHVLEGEGELFCETLLPKRATHRLGRQSNSGPESERHFLEIVAQHNSASTRFLHVL